MPVIFLNERSFALCILVTNIGYSCSRNDTIPKEIILLHTSRKRNPLG